MLHLAFLGALYMRSAVKIVALTIEQAFADLISLAAVRNRIAVKVRRYRL